MMAGSMNKVILVGYLGKDPDVRTTQSGKEIASFSIATKERWNDQDHTEWHRVVVLNTGIVNVVKSYVRQGSLIAIEGQLKTRKYQDKQGHDRYVTEIIIAPYTGVLTMLGGQK